MMKSKLLYVVIVIALTLVILLSLTACQNTKNDETENSKNTVSYIGKTTPEELIKTFYDDEETNKPKQMAAAVGCGNDERRSIT